MHPTKVVPRVSPTRKGVPDTGALSRHLLDTFCDTLSDTPRPGTQTRRLLQEVGDVSTRQAMFKTEDRPASLLEKPIEGLLRSVEGFKGLLWKELGHATVRSTSITCTS